MIIEFKAKNFLSIKDEMSFSMLASAMKDVDAGAVALADTDLSVMEAAVVYGANASGKSNFIKAFAFFKHIVTHSFIGSQAGEEIAVENFRLNVATAKEPTTMELTFTDGDHLFRYGFVVDRKHICSEWLCRRLCKKRAKEVVLFTRQEQDFTVHSKCQLMQELVNKKMVRQNALLLSVAAQFNDVTGVKILRWLANTAVLFGSDDEKLWNSAIRQLDDGIMRKRITDFARYADLGIEEIELSDNRVVSRHTQYADDGRESGQVTFPFTENESEGTIKYFSLAVPVIDALDSGKRLIVDELDSRLHPLLVRRLVSLFNSAEVNRHGAQLIFTTHDTNLLGAGMFRRDQVWFVQKDNIGATELYSLAEYKVRSTAAFEKEYLQGRYGATPILGDLERVFGKESAR